MSGKIKLVVASAGTGKTTRLARELGVEVGGGTLPERVLATTFTNAAAAELVESGRRTLLKNGKRGEALQLLLGRVGTVNSVFGALLADMAMNVGASPLAQVIPETAQSILFRIAADDAIGRHADDVAGITARFVHQTSDEDWREHVREIVEVARANGIAADALGDSARQSWVSMKGALPEPAGDGAALDRVLRAAVGEALRRIDGSDETGATRTAVTRLREAERALEQPDTTSWQTWARLSSLKAGAASNQLLDSVRKAAAAHPRHPRLHVDLQRYIEIIFACAADALGAYQGFKAARGLVDFADQEAEALKLLQLPEIAAQLASELDLLLVDEFQDTSPIQLGLFVKVASLARRSMWVGDPKQAIYGFRGSDPALVQAVSASITGGKDGAHETLSTTYRSRPAIVGLVNDAFGAALPPLGIPSEQVVVKAERDDAKGQPAALVVWRLRSSSKEKDAASIANGVADMLRNAANWPIQSRGATGTRAVRGGDIAILCRSNNAARQIAGALETAGLKVALGRDGLLDRAESVLALAGLRYAADGADTIALAEIAHFSGDGAETPAWLAAMAGAAGAAKDEASARTAARLALVNAAPVAAGLVGLRNRLRELTPAEALDSVIAILDIPTLIYRWGEAPSRLANLQALRDLAREYEEDCQRERLPATTGGLAAWFAELPGAAEPPSPDPAAIHVGTVHRAKGLEWPVVILADLDAEARPRLFDQPVAVPKDGAIDTTQPLAGRWIRFWPWPYGKNFGRMPSDVHLDTSASSVPLGKAAESQARGEEARLLYVATTRARDYLVFAPRLHQTQRDSSLKTAWLDGLVDKDGKSALVLPLNGDIIRSGGREHRCAAANFAPSDAAASGDITRMGPALPADAAPEFTVAWLSPSALDTGAPIEPAVIELGARLPLAGDVDVRVLGEALHSFIAADRPAAPRDQRLALATAILERWSIPGLAPDDAVMAADRLWQHIERNWPDAIVRREVPVFRRNGNQRMAGRVDLIVEHAGGLAILDHKAFPGGREHWPTKSGLYRLQLAAYATALAEATGKSVTFLGLHLPVSGVVLALPVP